MLLVGLLSIIGSHNLSCCDIIQALEAYMCKIQWSIVGRMVDILKGFGLSISSKKITSKTIWKVTKLNNILPNTPNRLEVDKSRQVIDEVLVDHKKEK